MTCCICGTPLHGLICSGCFRKWPKGMTFMEYSRRPYTPDPVLIPAGVSTAEDAPPPIEVEMESDVVEVERML